MNEHGLEKTLRRALVARGWDVYHGESVKDGFPDVLALAPDGYVLIEIKALGGAYRPAQKAWHREHAGWHRVYRLEEKEDGLELWSACRAGAPIGYAQSVEWVADFLSQQHKG